MLTLAVSLLSPVSVRTDRPPSARHPTSVPSKSTIGITVHVDVQPRAVHFVDSLAASAVAAAVGLIYFIAQLHHHVCQRPPHRIQSDLRVVIRVSRSVPPQQYPDGINHLVNIIPASLSNLKNLPPSFDALPHASSSRSSNNSSPTHNSTRSYR